jgi:hypothetical protein
MTPHRLGSGHSLNEYDGHFSIHRTASTNLGQQKSLLLTLSSKLSTTLCIGVLISGASGALSQEHKSEQAAPRSTATTSTATAEEHETDKQNMLSIYKALKAYEKEYGKLPDWLSDLVPKYIQDTNVLVSPFFRRTGTQELYGNEDPKLTTSYIYEFSAKPVPKVIRSAFPNLSADTTMREWKTKQVSEFGSVVPILRCFIYNPVLNVTSDGEFFESGGYWETDPKTLELRKKRSAAGGKSEDKENSR